MGGKNMMMNDVLLYILCFCSFFVFLIFSYGGVNNCQKQNKKTNRADGTTDGPLENGANGNGRSTRNRQKSIEVFS